MNSPEKEEFLKSGIQEILESNPDNPVSKIQTFLQNQLDAEYDSMDLSNISLSPSEPSRAYVRYGYYYRKVFIPLLDDFVTLKILRIRPVHGGHTHAVLPFYICPWTSFPASILLDWIKEALNPKRELTFYEFGTTRSTLYRIRRRFESFKRFLPDDWTILSFHDLTLNCLQHWNRVFLHPDRIMFGRLILSAPLPVMS